MRLHLLRAVPVRLAAGVTAFAFIVLALACADERKLVAPGPQLALAPSLTAAGITRVADVPALTIDLPEHPRDYDTDDAALVRVLAEANGRAFIGLKDPASTKVAATSRMERHDRITPHLTRKGTRAALGKGAAVAALNFLAASGVTVNRYYENIGMAYVQMAPEAAPLIRNSPLVDYVEPDLGRYELQGRPMPRAALRALIHASSQVTPWGVSLVRAPEAWGLSSGSGARLLIIDSGYERGHEDLPLVDLSKCLGAFGGCDDGPPYPHGTHVFGTIAARNNSVGVIGVAYGLSTSDIVSWGACSNERAGGGTGEPTSCSGDPLHPCNGGDCFPEHIAAALNWAAGSLGPRGVINMSFGGKGVYVDMSNASAAAWNAGHVLVASAGNDGTNSTYYPAGYSNVLGVSGILPDKTFAVTGSPCSGAGSSYGRHVDLAGPWYAFSTMTGNSYQGESQGWCGTSMAAPHVAGAALLAWSANPFLSNAYIAFNLTDTAERLGGGPNSYYGFGLPRADAAAGFQRLSMTADISGGHPTMQWNSIPLAQKYRIYRRITDSLSSSSWPSYYAWAEVTATSHTDYSTRVSSFYGYNSWPRDAGSGVSYYVVGVNAAGQETTYESFGTWIPDGIIPY